MPVFEWDEEKDRINQRKHGLTFKQGSKVFKDKNRLQRLQLRDGERRYLTVGKAFQVILTVVYTIRELTFRIISVRRASKAEREAYLSNSLSKQDEDYE